MAVVTKFKIYKSGRMDAGQFIQDSNDHVKLNVSSEAHVVDLDETQAENVPVKISKDGTIHAYEFREV